MTAAAEQAAAAMRRWAVIDQLVTTPIPWSPPTEVDDTAQPCDDWAEVLVQAAAFAHLRASPGCRGYTTWSSGRAGCGHCAWGMSARMGDVGALSSARFAQAAIARVGQAIALAVDELVQTLFEGVTATSTVREDHRLTDGDGGSGPAPRGSSRTTLVASLATSLAAAVIAGDHDRARAIAEELQAAETPARPALQLAPAARSRRPRCT